MLVQQGLGKFCDPEFVRNASREMQEALNMTQEEMDRAAHQLLAQEREGRGPLVFSDQPSGYQPSGYPPSPNPTYSPGPHGHGPAHGPAHEPPGAHGPG